MTLQHAGRWRNAVHRGVALALAMALHLVMFVWITRPVADVDNKDRAWPQSRQALQWRFIRLPQRLPLPALISVSARSAVPQSRQAGAAIASIRPGAAATRVAPVPVSPAARSEAPELHSAEPVLPSLSPSPMVADGDGGFTERLRQAKRSYSVGPLPGSDRQRVGGIELIDTKTQGIAAAVRQLQRLFGVPNHHCVDVDAWHAMSPHELSERHVSPSDIARVDAENQCNRPPGLSF